MSRDREMLTRAARLAGRSHGLAEPNPTVGCIVADAGGRIVGRGRTARTGGPHAEVRALAEAGDAARGGTAWVTLEPCNHHGRTPPCVDAVLAAGIRRLVVGSVDPNPIAAGGIDRLRAAGVEVVLIEDVPEVRRLHAPFLHRMDTGRPWIVAKWAETADGNLTTPPGIPPTISGPASHRMVHRERGRVDAILTGIGTVLNDDPRLTPRSPRIRRVPKRVVIDPDLDLPETARILQDPTGGDVLVATADGGGRPDRRTALERAGASILDLPMTAPAPRSSSSRLGLRMGVEAWRSLLTTLGRDLEVATVLTEAGPGVLHSLFDHDLVDSALVFTSPHRFDPESPASPTPRERLTPERFETVWSGRRGDDRVGWWQRRV